MAADKKINELPIISAVSATDVSILVHNGADYQFNFTNLLEFINSGINSGASISFGNSMPQNNTGKNGDIFVNTTANTFAQKTAGTWSIVYTLPESGSTADGTVLYGLGTPGTAIGNNNDTYIDVNTGVFYNKSAGTWAQVFSMQTGPQGAKGDKGDTGAAGSDGKTILSGTINPSNSTTGADGDFYLNTNSLILFGPKAAGVWGDGITIVGIQGEQGEAGADGPKGDKGDTGATGTDGNDGITGPAGPAGNSGPGVASGGSTGQVLVKISNNSYDTGWADMPEGDGADGLISGGAASVIDSLLTIQPATWRIGGNEYNTNESQNFTLSEPEAINSRYDLIFGNDSGLYLLDGIASANPVKPTLPINAVEIAFAFVQPGSISTGGVALANFATKQYVENITGLTSHLATDTKNNLVAALNEVNTKIGGINQESVILKIFKKSNYR